jgi:lipid II:glycine glycyltransferase (peptidoglycan interpeptide bridge formation enzyme)
LVKSEKQDIKIESSSSNEFVYWLSEIHEKNMIKKSFNGISKKMLQSISNENDLENPLIIYKASKNNNVIGSICIINHGKYATYLIGWTNADGRKSNVNYLLLWEAIKDLKLNNKRGFDLGGVDHELTPNITSFKSKMNGQNYNLVPSLWN